MGRPAALLPQQVSKRVRLVEAIVAQAGAKYDVILAMVFHRSSFKFSQRAAARVLHKR